PAPLNPPAPGEPGGLDNDTTPVNEAPFTEDSAQGAANVVQTYYALLEQGKYGQAYRLWEPGAAGMNAKAFAASFAPYSEYHANIGAPGRIDAGAGQRYVTVPVQVYGRLKQGARPFNMRGSVTLHRAGDIDGATAEQRRWRIRSADVKPGPGEATPSPVPTGDNRSTARYRCMDGSRLVARFDPDNDRVTVSRGGNALATLRGQRVASESRYAAKGYELRGKGSDMTFTAPGQPPIACTAIR
ncbi:MAG TPA: MliC family protein, partial [Sphingomonas sp.]|nr:MliC family protein [Sphingomonas sp.]